MDKARSAAQSRANLAIRFKRFGPPKRYAPPVRGWIKAVRGSLGMSTAQLAKRLKIKQPSVIAFERSEARGTIEVSTLRRVAQALDCTLVYALIPNRPLEDIVRDRAKAPIIANASCGKGGIGRAASPLSSNSPADP